MQTLSRNEQSDLGLHCLPEHVWPTIRVKLTIIIRMDITVLRVTSILTCNKVSISVRTGDGRVVQWSWVNFQCQGVLQFG